MKSTKHILLLTLMVAGLAACNDDDDGYIPPADSYLFSIVQDDWFDYDDGAGVIGYEATFELPALTENINYAGAVLVYLDFEGEGVFNALPHVYDNISYLYNSYTGSVQIMIVGAEGEVLPGLPGTIDCKVVLIDGFALEAKPGVNLKDLNAVESAFGIQVK